MSVQNASQAVQLFLVILGGVFAALVGTANLLSLIGATVYKPAQAWAEKVTKISTALHNFIAWLASFIPSTPTGQMRSARLSAMRAKSGGFIRVGLIPLLAVVVFCVCSMFACGILPGCAAALSTVAPVTALANCVVNVVHANPADDLAQVVAASLTGCIAELAALGGDVLTILAGIVASPNPEVAQYAAEAKATLADPSKLAALRSKVGHP